MHFSPFSRALLNLLSKSSPELMNKVSVDESEMSLYLPSKPKEELVVIISRNNLTEGVG